MENKIIDKEYWQNRWQMAETSWDIGFASPSIITYMETFSNKNASILIAGCGNAYEAEYLVNNGFTNITLIDIAPIAVEILKEKFKNYEEINVVCEDFFAHNGQYDLMIEQTFFCALHPSQRSEFIKKSHEILKDNGKIVGLLFNTQFSSYGPPFGGNVEEYRTLFSPLFHIIIMENCYNSILPRQGREVFIEFIKK